MPGNVIIVEVNPTNLAGHEIYRILTGTILPRPIAWVSTVDPAGNMNLAPFSFFTVASVNPPVLCFSPLVNDDRHEKDTLLNIRQTGEFVVNIVGSNLVERMNQTSAPYLRGVSEFVSAGVSAQSSVTVNPPGVQESAVRFECTLRQIISFGPDPLAGNLVLGNVCHVHLHPDIYQNGRIDSEALDAVGRLAGNQYATTRDRFEIARPELTQADDPTDDVL